MIEHELVKVRIGDKVYIGNFLSMVKTSDTREVWIDIDGNIRRLLLSEEDLIYTLED